MLVVDAVPPLLVAVAGGALVWAVATVLYRDHRRGAVLASAGVIAWFGFGHVAPALSDAGLGESSQVALSAVVVLGAGLYALRARSSLAGVTAGLNVVAVVLVAVSLATIVPYERARAERAASSRDQVAVTTGASGPARDVYFLVFDRYGSADALERRFGITDNDLYRWLEDRGFQVADESRANYRATDFSLAATLNMTHLDHLTETIGPDSGDRTPAQAMLRGHLVGETFRSMGYRTVHLGSWFNATASDPAADENITFGQSSEFESVLRDTTILPALERLAGAEEAGLTFRDRHREMALFQLRQLERLASAPGPKFVVAHMLLPHDPYVFRADGSVVPEDESRATEEALLYRRQLEFLNTRIKALVERLLAGPDASDPIVILQADEGPLGCRNTDCPSLDPGYLAHRFGVLNAIYLPGVDATLPEDSTLINTFPFVFREVFGADVPPLPDRSYTWPDNDHIYQFVDVTDRLSDDTATGAIRDVTLIAAVGDRSHRSG